MRPIKIGYASTDWSRSMTANDGPVPGGSNWIRIQQHRRYSKFKSVTGLLMHHPKQGFGVLDWKQKAHYDCDVIVLQRAMFGKLIDNLVAHRERPIINDVDDWYWGLHKENHAYKLTHPDHNDEENIDHYKTILKLSDAVTVSTPFLEQRMTDDFKITNVFRIENCVSVDDFQRRHHKSRKPILGWVGSTSHRSGDLEILSPVFQNTNFRIHHSGHVHGAATFAEKADVTPDRVIKTPMHHPSMYCKLSFQFDVGLAPLNDIPFNHAKSWIKAIEYSAAGVPFIGSDVGEYRRLHELYGIGRLANTDDEWMHHLTELMNYTTRSQEAKRNREVVREHLDVRRMAERWDEVLSNFI